MTKPVILTGIRANNDLHIGNYFGAMLPIIDMAKRRSEEFDVNLFIPDLHSFTTPINHDELFDSIMNNARVYTAAGLPLDNPSINLYRQSYVPAHSELTWILDCFTGIGELGRMTQFKDKSRQARKKEIEDSPLLQYILENKVGNEVPDFLNATAADELKKLELMLRDVDKNTIADKVKAIRDKSVAETTKYLKQLIELYKDLDEEAIGRGPSKVGLFNYPVLMAADILLYNASYIPVGDDQTQHLEFTINTALRMNNKFEEKLFEIPRSVVEQHRFFGKEQGLRIKDLVDPSKKMSKSDETGKGVIFLNDDPEVARKKIMSATTDDKASVNYDKEHQPGITNLIDILALLRGMDPHDVAAEYQGMDRYGDFKKIVADEMATFLTNFQQRLAAVNNTEVLAKLESSERAMNEVANATLLRVQKAVGLRR